MENTRKENTKINIYNIIIFTCMIIAFLVILIAALVNWFSQAFYVSCLVLLWIGYFIKPLEDYIKNKNEENLSPFVSLKVICGGFAALLLSLVIHALFFSDNISADNNYGLYKYTILVLIAYFPTKGFYKMLREIRNQQDKDNPLPACLLIIAKYSLALLLTFILPFYKLYESRHEVSLDNLITPIKIEAELTNKPPASFEDIIGHRLTMTITDKKLIEELIIEMRAMKLDNIRNLDEINYMFMDKSNYPVIELHGYYDSEYPSLSEDIKTGRISSIKIYNNGQVILESYNRSPEFLRYNFYHRYRVPLSEGMMNKLNKEFKNLGLK